ncbi:unnamed protein product [Didymodactylos carnosus]|uniref:Uncharacterized protein n=1 Tax=Didymodactylos carnosus TaxID=1234261 RepID=A0A8S2JQW9_9BILA|nr:unnamed protein product [Didymodactylos carnosus]CAF3822186.1 unnamed protein product [Didymodactylos carnosus]
MSNMALLTITILICITIPVIENNKDSIFNHIMSEEPLIVDETSDVVLIRHGDYYEVEDLFALALSVPITEHMCSLIPIENSSQLIMYEEYKNRILSQGKEENSHKHSDTSHNVTFEEFTNSTHHRSKRILPLIPLVVGGIGCLAALVSGIFNVDNAYKTSELASRLSQVVHTLTEMGFHFNTMQSTLYNVTATTIDLAKRFDQSELNQQNLEKTTLDLVIKMKNIQDVTDELIYYNVDKEIERKFKRLKQSISLTDLNFDFLGMHAQDELIELAYDQLKNSVLNTEESKATFTTRMLFAQTVRFQPTNDTFSPSKADKFVPKQMGHLVFISFFAKLKLSDKRAQIYSIVHREKSPCNQ